MNPTGNSQFSAPVLLDGNAPTVLTRVSVQDLNKDEDWFQQQLFKLPSLLPTEDVHIDFAEPIPVAREVPTNSGPIDLLFVNSNGCLTIVETKLRQNPEARRKVVGQIIDYASEIARLSYDDLVDRVKRAKFVSADPDPLISALRASVKGPFDEERLVRSISENLRRGRFLLLIVLDDTNETVERMIEFFSTSPQKGFLLSFTLALLEIAMFRTSRTDDVRLLFQPRLAAKTREITRAVVEIRSTEAFHAVEAINPPFQVEPSIDAGPGLPDAAAFFETLSRAIGADSAKSAGELLAEAASRGLKVDWMRNGPILKWKDPKSGRSFNFGKLAPDGTLACSGWLSGRCVRPGRLCTTGLNSPLPLCRLFSRCAETAARFPVRT